MTTIQRTLALAVLLAAACTKPHAPAEEPVNEDRPTNAWLADGGIRMDERSRRT